MKVINKVNVELSTEEHRTLLDAQKIWQNIGMAFDDNDVDIDYITDVLDKELSDLLDACDNGICLEERDEQSSDNR